MLHVPDDYEITIRPSRGWLDVDLGEIWRYRDLLLLLVYRDFVSRYKQTVLGPLWYILQPLMMTAVFTVVFGRIANIPTDGLPPVLFYLAGLLGWGYFAQTFQSTSMTLVANAAIFGKVYFPRLVVPLSSAISNLLAFAIQLATFICFWTWFKLFTPAGGSFGIRSAIVWLPLLVAQIAILSLAVGLWVSALTAKYRDFTHLSGFMIQIWMYVTPVIYPLSQIPVKWQWLAVLNPMAMPVEAIKYMFLGQGTVTAGYIAISAITTAALFVSGVLIFNKAEKSFVDTA